MILTTSGGTLLADGVPIKWCGANAYSLYVRRVNNLTPNAYITVIDLLHSLGVKVVRIFGDGFDQSQGMGLWETGSSTAIGHAQTILDYLASKGMGAIWCVHWAVHNVPAYKSEAVTQLTVNNSPSRNYLKLVIDTAVPAFRDHPALAAWSIGNELQYSLDALTLAQRWALAESLRGWIAAQDSSGRIIISDYADFMASAISGADAQRSFDLQWTTARAAESGFTTSSSHAYPGSSRAVALGLNGEFYAAWLERMARFAQGIGKPYLLTECGPDPATADEAANRLQCDRVAAAIENTARLQLACWWNCDTSDYSGNQANLIFNANTRTWVLEHLRRLAVRPYAPSPVDAQPRAALLTAGRR